MTDGTDAAEDMPETRSSEARPPRAVVSASTDAVAHEDDALPVVARLVIELRSDGRRTLARGAVTHDATGERAALEAEAESPWALMKLLAKELATMSLGAWVPARTSASLARPRRMLERLRALRSERNR